MPFIELRLATMRDADCLFGWRNDPATRRASHNKDELDWESHITWLDRTLSDSNRRLYVAEEGGLPVGTVRADFDGSDWELSWTVAPLARGRGVAKAMVRKVADMISDPIRAEVKLSNDSSASVARHAGMELVDEIDGVLHFGRQRRN